MIVSQSAFVARQVGRANASIGRVGVRANNGDLDYRRYHLSVRQDMAAWQVHIEHCEPQMPWPVQRFVKADAKEDAVARARAIVDLMLGN